MNHTQKRDDVELGHKLMVSLRPLVLSLMVLIVDKACLLHQDMC